jgi:hypothetical protein
MINIPLKRDPYFYQFFRYFCLLICIGALFGCSAHSNLTPVGKGNLDVAVSLGGPFIPIAETKIPTPYLSIGANYGISENMNMDANLHITSLFYQISGLDFGATWFPSLNEGFIPTWGIQPRLFVLTSFKSDVKDRFRIYPLVSSSSAWQLGDGLIYLGFDFVFPLTQPDYDKESVDLIFSPFTGYRWELGKNMRLISELKWLGANVKSDQLAVEYIKIGGYGAFSIMLSIEKNF